MDKGKAAADLPQRRRPAATAMLLLGVIVVLAGCGSDADTETADTETADTESADAETSGATTPSSAAVASTTSAASSTESTAAQSTTSQTEPVATSAETGQETVSSTAPDDASPLEAGTGRAIRISDTPDTADRPLDKGDVIMFAVPETFELVPELDPEVNPGMGHASFELDGDRITALRATVANVGASGGFVIGVDAGDYLVCLANSFPAQTTGLPYRVNGCAPVSLDDSRTFTLTFGEGGVLVMRP